MLVSRKNTQGQIYILLLVIILLAFTLRVYRLGHQSLWDDEAWGLLLARNDVIGIALEAAADVHPPLHYYLLHFWMPLAGNSEFAARFPSLFFGVLFVALFSRVSRDLLGADSAPLAGFVVALAPFLVYFSQEARMYTLAAFFSLLSFLLFWRALVTGHYLCWVIYVVATALALYTHYYAVFIVFFEAIYLLARVRSYRARFKGWLISQTVIGTLVMPWLLLVIQTIRVQTAKTGLRWSTAASRPASGLLENWRGNWAARQGIRFWDVVGQCLVSFSLGESVELSWGLALSLGFAALLVLGIFVLCRRKGQRHVGFLLILYTIIPFVLTYFSAFPVTHPHWAKYFMLSTPAYYLAITVGLTAKGRAQPWLLVGGWA
ncbi:MAG: glycosyltransferase family 39 protein, partial [Anaerolineae bacterium]|nr:glycosyltransferase family 39 protein [Anaerolineae bacterium]